MVFLTVILKVSNIVYTRNIKHNLLSTIFQKMILYFKITKRFPIGELKIFFYIFRPRLWKLVLDENQRNKNCIKPWCLQSQRYYWRWHPVDSGKIARNLEINQKLENWTKHIYLYPFLSSYNIGIISYYEYLGYMSSKNETPHHSF